MTIHSEPAQPMTIHSEPPDRPHHPPGVELDSGKVQADLLLDFGDALLAVAEVCTFGARKYTRHGWLSVPDGIDRYRAAFLRHALRSGVDKESGLPHAWHAAWNLLAVIQLEISAADRSGP